ncbi:unnamed protein product [Dovyalis caffra]|uniref:PDZ domain-containing protein n=1 Tax=Dovyalis caffra TaxID=77055 RepID=A0AAV1SFI9_9ROSI|nr:unnamed protein product [Dovyalis caffra]
MSVDTETPQVLTNEGIVEEAWEIVNDSFLDTGRSRRTPQTWQQKRGDILSSSIQSRAKAHDLIRRILASLGDPYTRFLAPAELSKMGRYDISGTGINLREIPDKNGEVKLKVLGLLLDGPAHSAGGDELLAVNGVDVKGKSAFELSSLLQGLNETIVKHGNCGPIQSLEVQRQLVARTPVFYRLEQIENSTPSVGYIRLKEFNALARKDLVIAMKRLQDRDASYFILDLKDNLGRLVQAGIEIVKLFLNEGEKVALGMVSTIKVEDQSFMIEIKCHFLFKYLLFRYHYGSDEADNVEYWVFSVIKIIRWDWCLRGKGRVEPVAECNMTIDE